MPRTRDQILLEIIAMELFISRLERESARRSSPEITADSKAAAERLGTNLWQMRSAITKLYAELDKDGA